MASTPSDWYVILWNGSKVNSQTFMRKASERMAPRSPQETAVDIVTMKEQWSAQVKPFRFHRVPPKQFLQNELELELSEDNNCKFLKILTFTVNSALKIPISVHLPQRHEVTKVNELLFVCPL